MMTRWSELEILFIFLSTLVLLICPADARFNSEAEEKVLRDILTNKLTKNSAPAAMVNDTVFAYFDLYQIVDVDEKNGILTLKLWMYIYYTFSEPLWDPDQYGGVRIMQFRPDTFWSPDIVPLDAVEVKYESYRYQSVLSYGVVAAWSSLVTVKFSCSFDVTYFPFDKHECPLRFGHWLSQKDDYLLGMESFSPDHEGELLLSFYKPHDQWKLMTPVLFEVRDRNFLNLSHSDIVVNIKIERLPRFYRMLFILPVILLYFLSPFVFVLPVESGEKTSMAITILLAQVVSMGVLSDILPESSISFPIIIYFLAGFVIQMGLNTVLAVIVVNVHNLDGTHKVPDCLRRTLSSKFLYVLFMTPCPLKKVRPLAEVNQPEKLFVTKSQSQKEVNGSAGAPRAPASSKEAIEGPKFAKVASAASKVESEENMIFMWKIFAVFLDRLMFLVNVVAMVIICVIFAVSFPLK